MENIILGIQLLIISFIIIGLTLMSIYFILFTIFGLKAFFSDKNLINFTLINSKKLKLFLNLLPKEYDVNNVPIFIFPNQFLYKLYILIFPSSRCYSNEVAKTSYGFYQYNLNNNNEDFIVLFHKSFVIELLHGLIHEFRHVYQNRMDYSNKSDYKNLIHFSNNNESYNQQFKEIDANRFASYFLKQHRKVIKKEFNLEFENFKIKSKLGTFSMIKYKDNSFKYIFIKHIQPKIEKLKEFKINTILMNV